MSRVSTTLVLDGHNTLHRVLHVPSFLELSCNGKLTGGLFGFLVCLRNCVDLFRPEKCIVVWDGERPEFRTELVPGYKKNREPKTDEEKEEHDEKKRTFVSQKLMIQSVLPDLGVLDLTVEDAEGDDTIYALTKILDSDIVIVSEDLDLAQLVSDRVTQWRPRKEEKITPQNFVEQVGCTQDRFLLKKAMVGDTSDNIQGVKGVGNKRADTIFAECVDPDIREYCAAHKSVPIRRVAECYDLVERNLQVMDLSKYPWVADTFEQIRGFVSRTQPPVQPEKVRARFVSIQLDSLLENFTWWIEPFRRLH